MPEVPVVLLGVWSRLALAGPLPVVWEDVSLDDPALGEIPARVYAPDAGGPYPLAGFLHGWLGSAWMYDEVCLELASWGFVVASLDTQTGLFLETDTFAEQAVALFDAVEARSLTPGDPLEGRISDGDRVVFGHSMGGATVMRWVQLDPRIRTAVVFMPYEGYAPYYAGLGGWDGSLLVLSGTADTTAPPAMQHAWFDALDATGRALLVEVDGMGHQAVTDLSFDEDPMPDAEQRRIVIALASTFVRAEHGGDEGLWAALIGPGAAEVDPALRSRSRTPALWAALDGAGGVSVGVAAFEGDRGELFFGAPDGAGGLVDPVSAGSLPLVDGVAGPATAPVPAGWAGALAVAAQIDGDAGPTWTRAVVLAEAEAEPPTEVPEPEPSPSAEPAEAAGAPRDSCGCTNAPAGSSGWAAFGWIGIGWAVGRARWRREPGTQRGRSSTSRSGS